MSAVELLKQATRRMCEEDGESWSDDAEANFDEPDVARLADVFAELVAAEANAARITAQLENEGLKARIVASGVAECRAVLAEREACAKVCHDEGVYQLSQQGNAIMADKCWFMRDEIRARGAT